MQLRGNGGVLNPESGDWSLWLDLAPRPGHLNMAIDQALLDLADREGLAVLRLYGWAPHCLSFGRHEPALRRYDRNAIQRQGLATVRRPTGGRAVWHAGELTYAVAAPIARFGPLTAAYRAIHGVLLDAVRGLGADAVLAPDASPMPLDAGACFAAPVGGEVMAAGRKVVGSAQLRQNSGLLQHGSLLLDDDQELVRAISRGPAPVGSEAPLNRLLSHAVSPTVAADAVAAAARAAWAGRWTPLDAPRVLERAATHDARYRSAEWTWRR